MKMKPIKAHTDSVLARLVPRILEDKMWVHAYLHGDFIGVEFEANAVNLFNHP